ncbi:hypothetical protein T10_11301 [Trichinella papuae]|uniref:Uncharacterized protein n=1 Tax=Trichinella papuae TaxID=268474 RepID=A0A0V1N3Z2_9BILA|nr:hypothetical protein T10_11301 [Trichinella papuae]
MAANKASVTCNALPFWHSHRYANFFVNETSDMKMHARFELIPEPLELPQICESVAIKLSSPFHQRHRRLKRMS